MVTKDIFLRMAQKYGDVGSWAIWEDAGVSPKSNMGHENVFDLNKNTNLLDHLNNNVIMAGLNFSVPTNFTSPFANFHNTGPRGNDFKIRFAFKDTQYYGAWMTDIIKFHEEVDSTKVKVFLRKNPNLISKNIQMFRQEISDLESSKPTIIAFGGEVFKLLEENLAKSEYSKIIKVTHYSHYISKENYRTTVHRQLDDA